MLLCRKFQYPPPPPASAKKKTILQESTYAVSQRITYVHIFSPALPVKNAGGIGTIPLSPGKQEQLCSSAKKKGTKKRTSEIGGRVRRNKGGRSRVGHCPWKKLGLYRPSPVSLFSDSDKLRLFCLSEANRTPEQSYVCHCRRR